MIETTLAQTLGRAPPPLCTQLLRQEAGSEEAQQFSSRDPSLDMFLRFRGTLGKTRRRNPLGQVRKRKVIEIWGVMPPIAMAKSHVLSTLSDLCSENSPFKGLVLIVECFQVVR